MTGSVLANVVAIVATTTTEAAATTLVGTIACFVHEAAEVVEAAEDAEDAENAEAATGTVKLVMARVRWRLAILDITLTVAVVIVATEANTEAVIGPGVIVALSEVARAVDARSYLYRQAALNGHAVAIADDYTTVVSAAAALATIGAKGTTIDAVHSEATVGRKLERANSNLATVAIVTAAKAIVRERDPIGSFITTRCYFRLLAVLGKFTTRMSSKSFTTSSLKDLWTQTYL